MTFCFNLTRRALLKTLSAAGAASAIPWADALAEKTSGVLTAVSPKELLDSNVKVINTYHDVRCHSSCMLKAYVRDGKLLAITSAGDIPLAGSDRADNSIIPIQRRGCARGYSERKRLYAPDRLKYPLLQTIERGNLSGFKRISYLRTMRFRVA